jgi:hypothetical protein
MRRTMPVPYRFCALLVLGWVACNSSGSGVPHNYDASADLRLGSGGATGKGGAPGSGGLTGPAGSGAAKGSGGAGSTGGWATGGASGVGGVTGAGGGPSRDAGLQLPDGLSIPDLPTFNPDAFTLPDLPDLFGEAGIGSPCAASVATGDDCQTGTDTICTPQGGTLCVCGFGDRWTCL